ncbi:MAG: TraB/GumN family protein [Flavobacteriales bacterium]|nr:TraB/GumN family protein [Flavobacteriales bacterium]
MYDSTAVWMKELTGYDLSMFNNMNPMTVELTISSFFQQQNFPMPEGSVSMDMYFQSLGAAQNKTVMGLETIETQIEVLYGLYSLERQTELLDLINRKVEMSAMMLQLNEAYRNQNLESIAEMMYDDDRSPRKKLRYCWRIVTTVGYNNFNPL